MTVETPIRLLYQEQTDLDFTYCIYFTAVEPIKYILKPCTSWVENPMGIGGLWGVQIENQGFELWETLIYFPIRPKAPDFFSLLRIQVQLDLSS